jgi:hypothetical protein
MVKHFRRFSVSRKPDAKRAAFGDVQAGRDVAQPHPEVRRDAQNPACAVRNVQLATCRCPAEIARPEIAALRAAGHGVKA